MSNSKHTPGPWEYQPLAGNHDHAIYSEPDGVDLALVRNNHTANARLIAAAPEMYDTAEHIHLDINGLHATMRATSAEYRASELCRAMDKLIARNAATIHKIDNP